MFSSVFVSPFAHSLDFHYNVFDSISLLLFFVGVGCLFVFFVVGFCFYQCQISFLNSKYAILFSHCHGVRYSFDIFIKLKHVGDLRMGQEARPHPNVHYNMLMTFCLTLPHTHTHTHTRTHTESISFVFKYG